MSKLTNTKLEKILLVTVILLLIALLVLAWQVWDLRDKNASLTSESNDVEKLINNAPGVLGRSCGILDKNTAAEILNNDDLELRYSNLPAPNTVNTQDGGIHWIDSCRYASVSSSTVYVELFIETYQTYQSASQELQNSLPKVGLQDIESNKFEELYYTSGAWYARSGEVVIKVTANDGRSGDLFDFSEPIFEQLVSPIE